MIEQYREAKIALDRDQFLELREALLAFSADSWTFLRDRELDFSPGGTSVLFAYRDIVRSSVIAFGAIGRRPTTL